MKRPEDKLVVGTKMIYKRKISVDDKWKNTVASSPQDFANACTRKR